MAIKMCSIALSATTDDVFCDLSSMKQGNKKTKMENKMQK